MMSQLSPEILVLSGGISHERDVSLRSAGRVADALRAEGAQVAEREPDGTLLVELQQTPPQVVWPVLHGSSGEDGALRNLLEIGGIPFVGSSAAASRLAWDKSVAKHLVRRAGVATPESVTLPRETFKELDATAIMGVLAQHFPLPLVVKPNKGGSSQGISFVTEYSQLPAALVEAFTYRNSVLVERKIDGIEIAATIVDLGDGPQTLPAVEIEPRSGIYSFEARYTAGETTFYCPARITEQQAEACASAALIVYETLGLRSLSRIDFILDADGVPWFLEANVSPGLTETSSVPIAIEAAGFTLGEAYRRLVETAIHTDHPAPE